MVIALSINAHILSEKYPCEKYFEMVLNLLDINKVYRLSRVRPLRGEPCNAICIGREITFSLCKEEEENKNAGYI